MKTFATLIPGNTRIVRKVSLLLAALLTISTVHAVTIINVQSSADGVANAANCPGAGCRLRDALAQAVDGDVIQFSVTGAITLTHGELQVQSSISIVGNPSSAVDGGAASRVFHIIGPGKTVSIAGLTIRNGKASFGGGIWNDQATLTLNGCTLSGNFITGFGGGILNDGNIGSASLTINNSTLSGNSASTGAAIYSYVATGGNASVTITNSTLSGNSASNAGGGIYTDGSGGSATLILKNSTLSGNSAQPGNGGAIQTFEASVTIGNTILNTGGVSGVNILNDGAGSTVTSSGYNLSNDGGVTNINGGGGSLNATGDQVNTEPMIAPLGDNGGGTMTHALLVGSPAIDKGKDLSGTGQDQRGRTRPNDDPSITNATGGDGSDIGAFELYTIKVTNNLDDNSTETLRRALADALPGDGIYFDPTLNGQTIMLTGGELLVSKSVDISGPGAANLAVDGNATSRVFHTGPGKVVTISGLTIRNGLVSGSLPGSAGGGIYNDHATLTLTSSTVTLNHGLLGGGIYNDSGGSSATLTVSNSTLSGNSANGGGAIYSIAGGSATVTLTNSTVSGNSAAFGGGGIANDGSAASGTSGVTVTNCTFSGNSAPAEDGGAIQNVGSNGTITVGNTILKAGASGANILNDSGAVISNGYNLSSDGGVTNTNGGTGSLNATGDHINTDPMLAPLGDNGGGTMTHALLIGSPAIDKGKDLSGTGQDQRGRNRPNDDPSITNATGGDGSDIGAFELYTIKVTNNLDDNSAETLRKALADALPGDGIYFDAALNGQAITLTGGELLVSKSVDISGPGAANLAVDGNAASRVFHIGSAKTVTISGLTIRNGLASGSLPNNQGGGIYNDHATLTVTSSTVTSSHGIFGGGICNDGSGSGSATLTISNSTLSGNSGAGGGGIYSIGALGSATLTLTNSTLSGNSASGGGGGIANDGSAASGPSGVTVTSSTFSGNSAPNGAGGAIQNLGSNATLMVGNTILKAGASGANILNDSGAVTSNGYNLSSDGGVANTNSGTGSLNATGDQVNTDPKLAPLGDNGGATFTHALLIGSPAIDKGKDLSGTGQDQRGRTRPNDDPSITNATGGDGSDIGAFELYTLKVTNNKDDNSTETLRKALADALPGDAIYFDPSLNGQTITLAFTSVELLVGKSVDISGPGADKLAVDGNHGRRVFHIAAGRTVTISGLTIRNGAASFPVETGGGIFNEHANLTLINSTVSGNFAKNGGGVFNGGTGGNASLTLINSTVSGNSSSSLGGGIYNDGSSSGGHASVTLTNSTLSGNSATSWCRRHLQRRPHLWECAT